MKLRKKEEHRDQTNKGRQKKDIVNKSTQVINPDGVKHIYRRKTMQQKKEQDKSTH